VSYPRFCYFKVKDVLTVGTRKPAANDRHIVSTDTTDVVFHVGVLSGNNPLII